MTATQTKPMNVHDAQRECIRRWGEKGYASLNDRAILKAQRAAIMAKPREQRTKEERIDAANSWRCTVGELHVGLHVRGQGDTFEEAFAAADKLAK